VNDTPDNYPALDSALRAGRHEEDILDLNALDAMPDNPVPTPTLAGYTPGVAPWLTADTVAIDKRVVGQRLRCPYCGCRRMTYHPYYRMLPPSYRARAVCPCGHSEEM